jgi:hypothetical protein
MGEKPFRTYEGILYWQEILWPMHYAVRLQLISGKRKAKKERDEIAIVERMTAFIFLSSHLYHVFFCDLIMWYMV